MKRVVIGSIAGVLFTALVAAQTTPQQTPPKSQDVTLTGCLVQGSSPNVFLLQSAVPADRKTDPPKTFRLTSTSSDDLKASLNHKVEVSGVPEMKATPPPPPGGKVDEKDLPVFSAKTIADIASTCGSTATWAAWVR